MISRRQIISRSSGANSDARRAQELRTADHFDPYSIYGDEDEEEDVWYSEERLFEDHIQEIVDKWQSIDDQIWAKIICMERNRRIAKAYSRTPVLTINGSQAGYQDGSSLGLNAFDNPDRDAKTKHVKQFIGQGCRIKIDEAGNILIKRRSRANVFIRGFNAWNIIDGAPMVAGKFKGGKTNIGSSVQGSSSGSSDSYMAHSSSNMSTSDTANDTFYGIVGGSPIDETKLRQDAGAANNGMAGKAATSGAGCRSLDLDEPVKLFDMKAFQTSLAHELRQPYKNRRKLQSECISIVSFVVDERKLLNLPSWVMIINIVALDLLRSKLGFFTDDLFIANTRRLSHLDDHRDDDDDDFSLPLADSPESQTNDCLACTAADGCGPIDRVGTTTVTSVTPTHSVAAAKKAFAHAAASGAYNGRNEAPLRHQSHHGSDRLVESSGFESNLSSGVSTSTAVPPPPRAELLCEDCCDSCDCNLAKSDVCELGEHCPTERRASSDMDPMSNRPPKLPHRPLGPPMIDRQQQQHARNMKPMPAHLLQPTQRGSNEFSVAQHTMAAILNGHPQPIMNQMQRRLPPGIPPHARLAPPATQRQVLRYLAHGCADRHHLSSQTTIMNDSNGIPLTNSARCQRPLPILPGTNTTDTTNGGNHDESLYYCGFQARVPPGRPAEYSGDKRYRNIDRDQYKFGPSASNLQRGHLAGARANNNNKSGQSSMFLSADNLHRNSSGVISSMPSSSGSPASSSTASSSLGLNSNSVTSVTHSAVDHDGQLLKQDNNKKKKRSGIRLFMLSKSSSQSSSKDKDTKNKENNEINQKRTKTRTKS